MSPIVQGSRRVLAVIVSVGAVALATAGTTQAHAFLIRSDPPAGARLAAAPRELVLRH